MPKSILLVEDNADINNIYQETLTDAGYNVTPVFNGTDAVSQTEENHFDLILLDVMLPGINGISVLKRVRESEKNSETPIYMLTVLDQAHVIKQALHSGANGFLIKFEFTPDRLIKKLKEIFSKHYQY